jgi:hypothetical protein
MNHLRQLHHFCAFALALLFTLGVVSQAQSPPAYRNIPLWPRPFADDSWVLGSVTGVATDAQNHVWVVHRGNEYSKRTARHDSRSGGQGQPSSAFVVWRRYTFWNMTRTAD